LCVMRDKGKSRWMSMNNQLFVVGFPFSFFFSNPSDQIPK
jgi:hypothetical protein